MGKRKRKRMDVEAKVFVYGLNNWLGDDFVMTLSEHDFVMC